MGAQIAVPAPLRNSALLGLGVHRPERIVTNDEICQQIDSSDEWIQSRSGIKERRFAKQHPEESVVDMATSSAEREVCTPLCGNSLPVVSFRRSPRSCSLRRRKDRT